MKKFIKIIITGFTILELFFVGGKNSLVQAISYSRKQVHKFKKEVILKKSPLILEHAEVLFGNAQGNNLYAAHSSHVSHVSHSSHVSHVSHYSSSHYSHYSSSEPLPAPSTSQQITHEKHFLLGCDYYINGKYKEALDAFKKAVKLENSSKYYFCVGLTYCKLEEYKNALNELETAKKMAEKDSTNIENKKITQYAEEQIQEIKDYLEKREKITIITEEGKSSENQENIGLVNQNEINIFAEVPGIKIQIFKLSLFEDTLGKLLVKGLTPLVFPKTLLQDVECLVIVSEKEGYTKIGLVVFPPFKDSYYVPFGERIEKPKIIGEEIILK